MCDSNLHDFRNVKCVLGGDSTCWDLSLRLIGIVVFLLCNEGRTVGEGDEPRETGVEGRALCAPVSLYVGDRR